MSRPRVSWTPSWAPAHVSASFEEPAVDEEGERLPSRVEASCAFPGCGGKLVLDCLSGRVRTHVATFASVHLHDRQ